MLAPCNTVQTPKSSLVPQGKDLSRAGIGKRQSDYTLWAMGWTQPSRLLIYSIELLIAQLSVTVYSYTQCSSNLLHFLVSTHGPCPSNPTNINPLKKTTWNLGIKSYISTNSNCWLIHHELSSRIKEGATDQEQNAESPEMLSTAAILSHMKHNPLGLRLLNPWQTRDGPNELSRSNSPSPLFTSKTDQRLDSKTEHEAEKQEAELTVWWLSNAHCKNTSWDLEKNNLVNNMQN
jgi:hypothetical protein